MSKCRDISTLFLNVGYDKDISFSENKCIYVWFNYNQMWIIFKSSNEKANK